MYSTHPFEGFSDFNSNTWTEKGTLEKLPTLTDANGTIIPQYRVIDIGDQERKGSQYVYLITYGFIQDFLDTNNRNDLEETTQKKRAAVRAAVALPLGVGKTHSSPQDLLDEICSLRITIRRTAGAQEKIVFGIEGRLFHLLPWKNVLTKGSIFSAIKVCSSVESVRLDTPQMMRPFFLTITKMCERGVYKIPKSILDMRCNNAVAFNLLVTLKIDGDYNKVGLRGIVTKDGEKATTFMIHIGNFRRRSGKMYSVDYCRQKVEKMDMEFALGAIGGLSLHIKIKGKISKRLLAQMGFKKHICYSLMDMNPNLNRMAWAHTCEIFKVTAVFQPSVPEDFKLYDDVLIDNTGKILKN
ncbi:MAG: matrix protein [Angavokely henipavirus]|nr:MAG: matrix protein [Angavokely henipavirus]